ncbi:protein-tyrosine phosphatase-like protein [Cokeromyces recurvatus]|uniref:protein-tyrosine phosphatase-like protein n=1 Tax=Cokeromyces recurvatus TaxID=90255 RepID=UPI002220DC75|nr:protein-tyrosine phosphatase-like protein [Cokeromyces recurvatus]KAI7897947.1 protein-tyrosine phosphatase-like protein [Cokeromyces recurvatus]
MLKRHNLEQQESFLKLTEDIRDLEKRHGNDKEGIVSNTVFTPLIDDTLKRASLRKDSILKRFIFYISLYYNKLAVNVFGFITGWNWYNRIDELVILGALPTSTFIKRLHQQERVGTIVNLCIEFPGHEKLYDELNMKQIRLETNDFKVPSLETIHKGIDEIMSIKNEQQIPFNSIYLHCKAGRGRSAAIAFCYLLRTYNLNLFECQKVLMEKRIQERLE